MSESWLPTASPGTGVTRYDATSRERTIAALTHLSIFLSFGLAAPIVWLLFRKSSPFIARHAARAAITHLGGGAAIAAISAVTCGIGSVLIVPLVGLSVYEAFGAWQGKWDAFKRKAS